MKNSLTEKFATVLGADYAYLSIASKVAKADSVFASLPFAARLSAMERAIAQDESQSGPESENDGLRQQLSKAEGELTQLKAASKDVTAEVNRRVAMEAQRLNAEAEERAQERAIEIMAGVGQPRPATISVTKPGTEERQSSLTGLAGVEAMYREKYEHGN